MDKPISLVLDELKNKIIKDINEASLPFCLVESILKNIYVDIQGLSQQQFDYDKKKYEESLKSESN